MGPSLQRPGGVGGLASDVSFDKRAPLLTIPDSWSRVSKLLTEENSTLFQREIYPRLKPFMQDTNNKRPTTQRVRPLEVCRRRHQRRSQIDVVVTGLLFGVARVAHAGLPELGQRSGLATDQTGADSGTEKRSTIVLLSKVWHP